MINPENDFLVKTSVDKLKSALREISFGRIELIVTIHEAQIEEAIVQEHILNRTQISRNKKRVLIRRNQE